MSMCHTPSDPKTNNETHLSQLTVWAFTFTQSSTECVMRQRTADNWKDVYRPNMVHHWRAAQNYKTSKRWPFSLKWFLWAKNGLCLTLQTFLRKMSPTQNHFGNRYRFDNVLLWNIGFKPFLLMVGRAIHENRVIADSDLTWPDLTWLNFITKHCFAVKPSCGIDPPNAGFSKSENQQK